MSSESHKVTIPPSLIEVGMISRSQQSGEGSSDDDSTLRNKLRLGLVGEGPVAFDYVCMDYYK